MKFFKNALSIYYHIKGREKLSEKNGLEALEFFRKAEKYEINFELLIHKGLAEFLLGMFDNSVMTLQHALRLVRENTKINDDEKKYLKYYILDILITNLNILHKYENLNEYTRLFKQLSFNKTKIRTRFLSDFPI